MGDCCGQSGTSQNSPKVEPLLHLLNCLHLNSWVFLVLPFWLSPLPHWGQGARKQLSEGLADARDEPVTRHQISWIPEDSLKFWMKNEKTWSQAIWIWHDLFSRWHNLAQNMVAGDKLGLFSVIKFTKLLDFWYLYLKTSSESWGTFQLFISNP